MVEITQNPKVKTQNFNSKLKTDLKSRCYLFSLNVIRLADLLPSKRSAIALKSANETQYWLCMLRDTGLVEKDAAQTLLAEAQELANMLAAGIMKLKSL